MIFGAQEALAVRCSANSPGATWSPAVKAYLCDNTPPSSAPSADDLSGASSADSWMPNAPGNNPVSSAQGSSPTGSQPSYVPYGASSGGCYSSYKNESNTASAGEKDPFDPSRTCGSDGQWSGSTGAGDGSKAGNPGSGQTDSGDSPAKTPAQVCTTTTDSDGTSTKTCGPAKWKAGDMSDPCNAALKQTTQFCTAANSSGLQQQAASVASMAAASSANAGAACTMQSKIADMQVLFNTGVAAGCTAEIISCRNSCDPEPYANNSETKRQFDAYTANRSTCNSLSLNAAQSLLQAAANGISAKAAKNCASAIAAAATAPAPVLAQTCAGNPNYAATHAHECYCASNPGDTKCLNPALAMNPGGAAPALSSGLNKGSLRGDPGGGSPTAYVPPAAASPGTGGASSGSSGGGGGMGAGGPATGAVAANAEDPGAGGGSGNGGNIFGGFSAGQGGFSYGHPAGAAASGGIAGAVKALATKLNLNGLLPKRNDYVNRAVAGMSVSAQDGVTGPNGPSIWEKVSRRYQIKKGELLPP